MNKGRIEAFSDGVFAVAITILVFNIKIPSTPGLTDVQVAQVFLQIWPQIVVYAATFFVLSVFWTNHHFIFHSFAKEVDRRLNLLNLTYLMFVVLVPFSAQLIDTYDQSKIAVILYGFNIFIVVLFARSMTAYIQRTHDILNPELSQRTVNQAQFRGRVTLICYFFGILCSLVWIPGSIFLYTFPIIFNFIPGTLDFLERHSRLDFD